MTIEPKPIVSRPYPARPTTKGSLLLSLLRTTDHKVIGQMYLVTSFGFFFAGGLMALLMRAELARPGMQFLSPEQYNQLFTMHGTIMLLLFATPLVFAFANLVLPLQIGAPDVSFPRLNSLSYWLFLFGGLTVMAGFITPGGAADFGWTAYSPLSNAMNTPGVGADLWIVGLALSGLGTILGGVNMITTVITLRAPGMTMFRMPIFTWNILVTSVLVLMAFPILTAALFGLLADRQLGAQVFLPENGGPMLWQHLFWFFGHPEVYIVALPFFGIITEVIPVFSRKPLFGYKGLVFATLGIAALSMTVWAHHMFVTGAVLLPFFSFLTFLIAVPTGIKFFNWIGTMWRGRHHRSRHRCCSPSASWSPSCSAGSPACCSARRRSTSTSPTRTSWWRTSTTCCSARSCSPCSPASTSGSRSSPAATWTTGWASCTSGPPSSAST